MLVLFIIYLLPGQSSSSDRPLSAAEVYSKVSALPAALPDILACLRVAFTLPVASATAGNRPLSAAEVYSKVSALPAALPDILACLRVAFTLPVASATAGCSFSAMRCIKCTCVRRCQTAGSVAWC